jgi:hypothetical protein
MAMDLGSEVVDRREKNKIILTIVKGSESVSDDTCQEIVCTEMCSHQIDG